MDALLDAAFGQRLNPMRHLGALGFLFFWLCCASGIWIYAGFDTSATGAWQSIAAMDANDWPLGAFARALHRYSADALVAVTALHLVRELSRRHYAAFRRFAWLTGLVALVRDGRRRHRRLLASLGPARAVEPHRDHRVARRAAPFFDGVLARNAIAGDQVNDRFFSLLIFLHIGLPLAMLGMMWAHVQRVSPARTHPPAALAWGSTAMLAALCLAKPISLMPPADLGFLPARIPLDWFYLFPHPAMAWLGPGGLWLATAAFFAGLAALPWATRVPRAPAARVDLDNCNGCARCFADCPYGAVVMVPRTDARHHPRQAQVDPDLCAGCGICTGACPSSTPFRHGEALATGIDMPSAAIGALRATPGGAHGRPRRQPAHRRVRLPVGSRRGRARGPRHGHGRVPLRGDGAALVHRVRAARRCRRRARGRVPGRRLRVSHRRSPRRREARRRPQARAARERAARARAPRPCRPHATSSGCAPSSPPSAPTCPASPRARPTAPRRPNARRSTMASLPASSLPARITRRAAPAADYGITVARDASARLATGWLVLGVAALVGSGLFSLLLVLARTPGLKEIFPVANLFQVALVAHVDLSVLVWFLAFAGVLWSLACDGRAIALGWVGPRAHHGRRRWPCAWRPSPATPCRCWPTTFP